MRITLPRCKSLWISAAFRLFAFLFLFNLVKAKPQFLIKILLNRLHFYYFSSSISISVSDSDPSSELESSELESRFQESKFTLFCSFSSSKNGLIPIFIAFKKAKIALNACGLLNSSVLVSLLKIDGLDTLKAFSSL